MATTKILQLITLSEIGGAQRMCALTTLGLRSRGYDVDVACQPGGWLETHLSSQGIKVIPLPQMSRAISPSKDVATLRQITQLIRSQHYELVHCHSSKAGTLGRIAAALAAVPSIFTAHGWAFSEGVPAVRKAIAVPVEMALARLSSRIICVSEYDKHLALRLGITSPSHIRVIHNGIEDNPTNGQVPTKNGQIRFTMVARFAVPKDQYSLLQATLHLKGNFRITFVGDGPRNSEMLALSKQLGIADKVLFLGERHDVESILRRSDVGVLVSDWEGLPLSIIESMRAGLPIVATDTGGIPELVRNNVNGILVPRKDIAALAAGLQTMIDSAELRNKLGTASRQLFEEKFNDQNMVDQIIDTYVETLHNPKL